MLRAQIAWRSLLRIRRIAVWSRCGDWKAVWSRCGDWKYVDLQNQSRMQFNLNEGPYEAVNLAQLNRYRAERKKPISLLKHWVADTSDKFAVPEH
jgi:hypothetical protein